MPKTAIHPTYYPDATVACSCGATYVIGSTKEGLKVEICSNCHPFYSGNAKMIDTAGRVDRFREKMAAAQAFQAKAPKKAEVKAEEVKEAPAVETETAEEVAEPTQEEAVEAIEQPTVDPELVEAAEDTDATEQQAQDEA